MSFAVAILLVAGQAALPAVEAGYDEISDARYADAIRTIEADPDFGNPAQLINLALAYARQGDEETARRLLRTALAREPVMLEASDGKWHDSRWMAWQALADLGPDDSSRVRTASR